MARDVLDKANQLAGKNKGKRRYKMSLCKVIMQSMFSCQER